MAGNRQARRGRSKEKLTDCPLVTLGLVLDGSGFIRRSRVFDGNVSEATTLQGMLIPSFQTAFSRFSTSDGLAPHVL